jgi:hypothetical protein
MIRHWKSSFFLFLPSKYNYLTLNINNKQNISSLSIAKVPNEIREINQSLNISWISDNKDPIDILNNQSYSRRFSFWLSQVYMITDIYNNLF